jgi:hypothetical protein
MAKKSSIEKNNRRRRMAKQYANRRAKLKAIAYDKKLPMEERFAASLKLAESPARLLPQAPLEPYRVARARVEGPDSGPCEVELVGRARWSTIRLAT